MAHAHYVVTERKGGWFIAFEGNSDGPIPGGQAAALTAAVQIAHQAGKDGHNASVCLRLAGGSICTVWSFGNDPYPPPWVEDLRMAPPARRRPAML